MKPANQKDGSDPRKHHFVPKCWLGGFTETGESDGRLWVTDLSRQKQWPTTPEKAGWLRDFYRLSDPARDPGGVEKLISKIESEIAPVLKAVDREGRPPRKDELDAIIDFMAVQWARVPKYRRFAFRHMD